jgi:hypothetical protein
LIARRNLRKPKLHVDAKPSERMFGNLGFSAASRINHNMKKTQS